MPTTSSQPSSARHDRRRAQRQHHRDRVNPALVPAAVGHLPEPLQQVSTHSRRSRDVVGGGRARHGRAQPGESGLGNDRMQPQRSSGGEKSVRGLLLLPELRRLSRHDTPKIAKFVSRRSTPGRSNTKINDLETTVGFGVRGPTRSGVSSQHTA